jgi:hypothetical protein
MDKFINKYGFMSELFDDPAIAERAGEIGEAILEAGSLILTDITLKMEGSGDAYTDHIIV